jgi:hypothetical protein
MIKERQNSLDSEVQERQMEDKVLNDRIAEKELELLELDREASKIDKIIGGMN